MEDFKKCDFSDPDSFDYLIEYRGNFLEEIDKVDYACGYTITDKYGIVIVKGERMEELLAAVPSILFVKLRSIFILEKTSINNVGNIGEIKQNQFLNLNGSGVLVGLFDTGIDYLNKEFINEDGSTRIEVLWDQTIDTTPSEKLNKKLNISEPFLGKVYTNEDINKAIKAKERGENPYTLVPSKDDIGHGTEIASIAGARGYDSEVQGVANNCSFAVVKLREAADYKLQQKENNLPIVPVYNNALIVAGMEFLKIYGISKNKPIVLIGAVGTPDHPHDGSDLFTRYVNETANTRGVVYTAGTGNEGASGGHTLGIVKNINSTVTKELYIPVEIHKLKFNVWVRIANKLATSIISPSGESTGVIEPKFYQREKFKFVLDNTELNVSFRVPDLITGLEIIILEFKNIKSGIWKLILEGRAIVDGRFDIWLPAEEVIPKDTKFLEPDPNQTINAAGTAQNAVTTAYFNQENGASIAASGKGYPLDGIIKPNIIAPGVNINAVTTGNRKVQVSGSSVAASIVGGACALLLQWGIVDGNDLTLYSPKIISYLIYGADRNKDKIYPNNMEGYGKFDILGAFYSIAGINTNSRGYKDFLEYKINNLYVRIPNELVVK